MKNVIDNFKLVDKLFFNEIDILSIICFIEKCLYFNELY